MPIVCQMFKKGFKLINFQSDQSSVLTHYLYDWMQAYILTEF